MFELMDVDTQDAVIKVIGVGGCGGNAVDHMISSGLNGVEFIAINTDAQALKRNQAKLQLQLGNGVTKGLGAGANPEVGREAALEDRERIAELIDGADMLFITAGMGGGTGTGAAPVVAEVAKELGILTVAVVTKPFMFEGKRVRAANAGIEALARHVDSLIIIPNEKLMQVLGDDVSMLDAFKAANNVLHGAVGGIAEVINCPGLVNVDFADVRTVMGEVGMAMMGSATSAGVDRARLAAQQAVKSPLLEDVNLAGARGVLVYLLAYVLMNLGAFLVIVALRREGVDTVFTLAGDHILPLLDQLSLMFGIIARPSPARAAGARKSDPSVSVIIPCRNEAGHIPPLVASLPKLAPGSEFLFVEGNSQDDTEAVIRREVAAAGFVTATTGPDTTPGPAFDPYAIKRRGLGEQSASGLAGYSSTVAACLFDEARCLKRPLLADIAGSHIPPEPGKTQREAPSEAAAGTRYDTGSCLESFHGETSFCDRHTSITS